MKLIAMYKAFSGGELFRQSLESVRLACDGAVVMMSDNPWLACLPMAENCSGPLDEFEWANDDFPVLRVHGHWDRQENQYAEGLREMHRVFGEDAVALIIDTDEIWDAYALRALKVEIEASDADLYRSKILTYIKSPLYQVWPQENVWITVAVRGKPESIRGRFQPNADDVVQNVGVSFHHYPYVRDDESSILQKLVNTGCQEASPSDPAWVDTVWPRLPIGRNLHMTVGEEHWWNRIKMIAASEMPDALQGDEFAHRMIDRANQRWREWVDCAAPNESVIPNPQRWELDAYARDICALGIRPLQIFDRIKNTIYEQVILASLAQQTIGETGDGVVVEIGSGEGGSAAAFGEACLGAKIYCIDPFELYEEEREDNKVILAVVNGTAEALQQTAEECGFADRMTHIRKYSDKAIDDVPDADVVFVDGDHSYDVVLSDLRLYWPKVKPGGIMLGHDYTTRFPGVIHAVKDWENETGLTVTLIGGSSIFYIRKPEVSDEA